MLRDPALAVFALFGVTLDVSPRLPVRHLLALLEAPAGRAADVPPPATHLQLVHAVAHTLGRLLWDGGRRAMLAWEASNAAECTEQALRSTVRALAAMTDGATAREALVRTFFAVI